MHRHVSYCFQFSVVSLTEWLIQTRSLADLRVGFWSSDKYIRSDYNFHAVLRDSLPEEMAITIGHSL